MRKILISFICLLASVGLTQTSFAQSKSQSRLAKFPGFGHNFEADEKQYVKEENERRRMIGKCMKAQGHKFWPTLVNPSLKSASFSRGEKLPPKIRKNNDYIDSLSNTERETYYLALYGVSNPNDPENLWDPRSGTGGGCEGAAIREIPGVFSIYNEVAEDLATMRHDVMNSAEVSTIEAEWSLCMKSKGKSFKSPKEMFLKRDMELRTLAQNDKKNGKTSVDNALSSDQSCRKSIGFRGKMDKVIGDKETKFFANHKSKIDKARKRYKAQRPIK